MRHGHGVRHAPSEPTPACRANPPRHDRRPVVPRAAAAAAVSTPVPPPHRGAGHNRPHGLPPSAAPSPGHWHERRLRGHVGPRGRYCVGSAAEAHRTTWWRRRRLCCAWMVGRVTPGPPHTPVDTGPAAGGCVAATADRARAARSPARPPGGWRRGRRGGARPRPRLIRHRRVSGGGGGGGEGCRATGWTTGEAARLAAAAARCASIAPCTVGCGPDEVGGSRSTPCRPAGCRHSAP